MSNQKNIYAVEVTHIFNAPPSHVYDAWLNPDLVQKWFGPGLGQTQPVTIDAIPGGKFRIVQIRNNEPVGHSGEYLVLDRPSHIAFTWSTDDDDGHDDVHVYITALENGSSVRLVHRIDEQWKDFASKVQQAWASMLNEMDILLKDRDQPTA